MKMKFLINNSSFNSTFPIDLFISSLECSGTVSGLVKWFKQKWAVASYYVMFNNYSIFLVQIPVRVLYKSLAFSGLFLKLACEDT